MARKQRVSLNLGNYPALRLSPDRIAPRSIELKKRFDT